MGVLSAARVSPSSLPPAAILLVRSLRDPLPRVLPVRNAALPPLAWEQAAARQLDDCARRAARPAREPVGDGVEAVLFLDRAELLACLAADELRGVAGTRWWWRLLGPQPRLAQAFLESPEHVPGALEAIASTGEAGAVVRTLTDAAAAAVLAAVRRVFAVPEPSAEANGGLAEAEVEPRPRARTRARGHSRSHESARVVVGPERPASGP